MIVKDNFLGAIGQTPMVDVDINLAVPIKMKLEYLSPGGSVKDRSAFFMVDDAIKKGLLKKGGTIVEASSGNQGIALAMIGAVLNYNVIITVPARTSPEKVGTMRAYGARVIICGDTGSSDGEDYCQVAKRLVKQIPNAYMPNQYFNVMNSQAHFATTGPEIWEQTKGKVTHVFVGAGSCGTITGIGRFLKAKNNNIQIIGIDTPTSAFSSLNPEPYETEGIGIDHLDGILDVSVVDAIIPIGDELAFARTRWLAKRHGLLVGPSSGAVIEGVMEYGNNLFATDVPVAICADSGRAYLQKIFAEIEPTLGTTQSFRKTEIRPARRLV